LSVHLLTKHECDQGTGPRGPKMVWDRSFTDRHEWVRGGGSGSTLPNWAERDRPTDLGVYVIGGLIRIRFGRLQTERKKWRFFHVLPGGGHLGYNLHRGRSLVEGAKVGFHKVRGYVCLQLSNVDLRGGGGGGGGGEGDGDQAVMARPESHA